jgi:hypothetical protein
MLMLNDLIAGFVMITCHNSYVKVLKEFSNKPPIGDGLIIMKGPI